MVKRIVVGIFLALLMMLVGGRNQVESQDYPQEYSSAVWSPDGAMIATSGNYGSVQVWDTEGHLLFDLGGHYPESYVDAVVWSPDSSRLASAGTDRDIHIWFIQPPTGETSPYTPGQQLSTLSGHEDRIYDLAWSPDGSKLISVSLFSFYGIRIWDMDTYTLLVEKEGPDVNDVVWSPDGTKFLVSAEAGAFLIEYDAISQAQPSDLTLDYSTPISDIFHMPVSSVEWKAHNTTERIALGVENEIRIYDGDTLSLVDTIPSDGFPVALSWNQDLTLLAGVGEGTNHVNIWDVATGALIGSIPQKKASLTVNLAWSPDGAQLAYGDLELHIVDVSEILEISD